MFIKLGSWMLMILKWFSLRNWQLLFCVDLSENCLKVLIDMWGAILSIRVLKQRTRYFGIENDYIGNLE